MANASVEPRRPRAAPIDFEGRVGRLPFALVAVGTGVALAPMIDLAALCVKALGAAVPVGDISPILRGLTFPQWLALPLLVADGLAITAIALVLLSFQVRRLHDMNMSGWLVLGFLVLRALPFPDVDPLPSIASLIWFTLLAVVPGTPGPNAHGPPDTGAGRRGRS